MRLSLVVAILRFYIGKCRQYHWERYSSGDEVSRYYNPNIKVSLTQFSG